MNAWDRMLLLVNEYAGHVADAALHQAASLADLSRSAALKSLGEMREAFFAHSKDVAETERPIKGGTFPHKKGERMRLQTGGMLRRFICADCLSKMPKAAATVAVEA